LLYFDNACRVFIFILQFYIRYSWCFCIHFSNWTILFYFLLYHLQYLNFYFQKLFLTNIFFFILFSLTYKRINRIFCLYPLNTKILFVTLSGLILFLFDFFFLFLNSLATRNVNRKILIISRKLTFTLSSKSCVTKTIFSR